jgi:flagellar hook assembly protein FlgD
MVFAAALPLAFAPQANSTTFSASFSEAGNWALSLFDPGEALVKSFAGAGTQVAQSWAGDDAGGAPLPAATYGYRLDVQGASGNAAPIRGELGLDPGLLTARIDSPLNLAYLVGSSIPVQGVASGAGLTSYVLSFAPGGAPADAAFTTIATATTPISGSIASWNAAAQTQGVYTLRLQANGPGSSSARAEALVRLVSATGTTVTPDFSPNADGVLDLASVVSQLSVDAPWTLRFRNAASQIVRELSGDLAEVGALWDGRNAGGTVEPDGPYSVQLVAAAIPAQPVLATTSTTLDNTRPTALIDLPSEGAPIRTYDGVPITGTAHDLNLKQYQLAAAPPGSPTAFATFATVGSPVVAGALGSLPLGGATTPAFTNGTLGLRLTVEDRAGNQATDDRTIQIDQLRISNVSAAPARIDPLLGQTAVLAYSLDRPADVSIALYRSNSGGALARTLLLNAPRASGANSESWDGRAGSGDPVPATAYYLSISATDAAGRVAVYNPPSAPLLADGVFWSGVRFNGATTPGAAVFNPFRNDELRIDYTMSGPGLHSIEVLSVPCCAAFRVPLRTLTPVAEGPTTLRWDGRLPSGAVLSQAYQIFFDFPRPIEADAIFVDYDFPFGDVRTNPYVFHPTLAEVTNLKYQLPRQAEVTVDVIDPNGNFLVTVQPTTLQPAGDYEMRWDGLDANGLIVTTEGSYTLDLRARDLATNQVYVRRATTLVAR